MLSIAFLFLLLFWGFDRDVKAAPKNKKRSDASASSAINSQRHAKKETLDQVYERLALSETLQNAPLSAFYLFYNSFDKDSLEQMCVHFSGYATRFGSEKAALEATQTTDPFFFETFVTFLSDLSASYQKLSSTTKTFVNEYIRRARKPETYWAYNGKQKDAAALNRVAEEFSAKFEQFSREDKVVLWNKFQGLFKNELIGEKAELGSFQSNKCEAANTV